MQTTMSPHKHLAMELWDGFLRTAGLRPVAVLKYAYDDPEEGVDSSETVDDEIRGEEDEDHGTEGEAKKE